MFRKTAELICNNALFVYAFIHQKIGYPTVNLSIEYIFTVWIELYITHLWY